jgi:hypothetical protein
MAAQDQIDVVTGAFSYSGAAIADPASGRRRCLSGAGHRDPGGTCANEINLHFRLSLAGEPAR